MMIHTRGQLLSLRRNHWPPAGRSSHAPVSKVSAISRLGPNSQPSSYQAAALDAAAAQPLCPRAPIALPAQQPASAWHTASSEQLADIPSKDSSATPSQGQRGNSITWQAKGAEQAHIHVPFAAFSCYLGVMAAAATNADWYLDVAAFGSAWTLLWVACTKLQPSANTVVLLCLLPVMHLAGALGMYHWELGNLSWDVLVHISNGFIGTLLFASVLHDMAAAGTTHTDRSATASTNGQSSPAGAAVPAAGSAAGSWKERAWGVAKVSALLLLSTSMIEVVEAAGGQLAGHAGEGIFLRGAGDMCTASLPCSEEVDTAKDMVDNCAGMMLALLALATRGSGAQAVHRGARAPAQLLAEHSQH